MDPTIILAFSMNRFYGSKVEKPNPGWCYTLIEWVRDWHIDLAS
jgi:hypothetical protein